MAGYELQRDEVELFKVSEVRRGGRAPFGEAGDLILTNKAVVFAGKSSIFKQGNTYVYPLHSLKTYNGQVQVKVETKFGENPVLRLFLDTGEEAIISDGYTAGNFKKMANAINEAVNGASSNSIYNDANAIFGAKKIAEGLKGTVGVFADAMGSFVPKKEVSGKCPGCGATIHGLQGESIKCEYCGTRCTL